MPFALREVSELIAGISCLQSFPDFRGFISSDNAPKINEKVYPRMAVWPLSCIIKFVGGVTAFLRESILGVNAIF